MNTPLESLATAGTAVSQKHITGTYKLVAIATENIKKKNFYYINFECFFQKKTILN